MPPRLPEPPLGEPLLGGKRRPVKVLTVDDSPGFRAALRTLVEGTPGVTLLGEAACGEDAITAVPALGPDLVLMDVRMPGIGGIEAARVLLRRDPDLVVMLMSADELQPLPAIVTSDRRAVFVRKQNLCARVLLDQWSRRRTWHGSNGILVQLG